MRINTKEDTLNEKSIFLTIVETCFTFLKQLVNSEGDVSGDCHAPLDEIKIGATLKLFSWMCGFEAPE